MFKETKVQEGCRKNIFNFKAKEKLSFGEKGLLGAVVILMLFDVVYVLYVAAR